ncbi:MAG: ammonium transporter [Lacisediminihabitans sp.]
MISGAPVLLMVLGGMFFYGGMRGANSIVGTFRMSFGAMGLIGALWVLYGYGLSFGPALIPGFLGNPSTLFGLGELVGIGTSGEMSPDAQGLAFAGFQGTVAILTVSLISAAIADRATFGAWMVFAGVWATVVYFPLAYSVFNVADGWAFNSLQINDLGGGTVIYISSGAAALALAIVLGRRTALPKDIDGPRNTSWTLLGAALLWFGGFGVNLGAEGVVDQLLALEWINTLVAPGAAILGWLIVEKIRAGKPTARGAASGAVAGLVAITPACNILTPLWAILLGLIAGAVCALAVTLKYRLGFDDSFDAVGIQLVGGLLGMVYVGLFGSAIGWRDNGQPNQLAAQATAAIGIAVYSFAVAFVIGWVIENTMGFRVRNADDLSRADVPPRRARSRRAQA